MQRRIGSDEIRADEEAGDNSDELSSNEEFNVGLELEDEDVSGSDGLKIQSFNKFIYNQDDQSQVSDNYQMLKTISSAASKAKLIGQASKQADFSRNEPKSKMTLAESYASLPQIGTFEEGQEDKNLPMLLRHVQGILQSKNQELLRFNTLLSRKRGSTASIIPDLVMQQSLQNAKDIHMLS